MWQRTIVRLTLSATLLALPTACASSAGSRLLAPTRSSTNAATQSIGSTAADPISGVPTSESPTSQAPTTSHSSSSVVDAYVRQCASNIQSVVSADLRYARRVSVRKNRGELYTASLLLSGAPSSVVPIPTRSGTQVPLRVECRAGARLVAADSGVTVAKTGDSDGWRYEQFTAVAPNLTWPWTITGTHLGDQQLLLEIRPAVVSSDGGQVVSSTVLTEPVTVEVTGSLGARIEQAGESVQSNVGTITGLLIGTLAGLTALLLAVTKFRNAFFGLFRRRRAAPAGAPPADDAGADRRPRHADPRD